MAQVGSLGPATGFQSAENIVSADNPATMHDRYNQDRFFNVLIHGGVSSKNLNLSSFAYLNILVTLRQRLGRGSTNMTALTSS